MIVIDRSYMIEALRVANNNLGKNQRDSGLNFFSSVIKGKGSHSCIQLTLSHPHIRFCKKCRKQKGFKIHVLCPPTHDRQVSTTMW